jgi:ribosome-associated translation inhibitor RaiA
MCRITINGQGVEITDSVRRLIESDLGAVLEPHGGRVAFAHVRVWEPPDSDGPTTCYIRVDLKPSGCLALGATAPDLTKAVRQASERLRAAVENKLRYPTATAAYESPSLFRV